MRKNKKQRRIMFLLILILGITIGFALLSTTLYINGTAAIKSNTWNIHWDDTSVNVTQGSVSATAPSVTTATSTKDTVSFDVEFEMPGDFYEFEIDAINEGSVDGALELSNNWITYKSNNVATTLPSYMDFKVTYDDGTTVPTTGNVLEHGQSQTYKIRVEFKSGVEELPSNPQPITIEVSLPYVQHKETCPEPDSFFTDSWDTITCNVRKGNTNKYYVGMTKSVQVDGYGTGTVRIVNKSTPEECSTTGFSQSGCGFVLEFLNIVTTHRMNPAYQSGVDGTGTKGGWEHSELRNFMNTTIYNALPSDLKRNIIDTTVVSGYGYSDSSNFVTTDKLYVFNIKEVNADDSDTSNNVSRIVDYYTGSNAYTKRVKSYQNTNTTWWLRSATNDDNNSQFYSIYINGISSNNSSSNNDIGVSPAFRLG